MVSLTPLLEVFECKSCGEEFTPVKTGQIYCKTTCRRGRYSAVETNFVGVDGEGLGDDPSQYVLLTCGRARLENEKGLGWKECFQFLYTEYMKCPRGTVFVGFYLSYDFTQMLKSLPEKQAVMLFTERGKALRKHREPNRPPHCVKWDGWEFDILGMKRFKLRPAVCACVNATCEHKKTNRWLYVCDTGPLWQSSFLTAIDPKKWDSPIVSDKEFELIREGKERRGDAVLDEDMRKYNELECEVTERMCRELDEGFKEVGVKLASNQWFGPGQAAAVWLGKRIEKSEKWLTNCVPEWFLRACSESYFGGWFEIYAHGHVPGTAYEYDINSAYPFAISKLPCLLHGTYSRGTGRPEYHGDSLCLVRARVWSNGVARSGVRQHRVIVGSMLHRDRKGNISRPDETEGWYWLDELEAAVYAGLVGAAEFYEWVRYDPCNCPYPFREVRAVYDYRLRVGKNTAAGKSAKLVPNSAYGKFAQSVGEPPFGNPVYASRITSVCRRIVTDAIATHPDGVNGVLMVATDAVFFRTPHPELYLSNKLGDWECVEKSNLTLFKPGVYWDDKTRQQIKDGKSPAFKSRGVNARALSSHLERIDQLFRSGAWSDGRIRSHPRAQDFPSVRFQLDFAMVTPLQALARNKWHLCGQRIENNEVTQNADPSSKRAFPILFDEGVGVWRSWAKTLGVDDRVSCVYKKRFGLEDPWSDESRQEYGVSPDGMIGDLINYMMKGD